jgi:hypothetical protein
MKLPSFTDVLQNVHATLSCAAFYGILCSRIIVYCVEFAELNLSNNLLFPKSKFQPSVVK